MHYKNERNGNKKLKTDRKSSKLRVRKLTASAVLSALGVIFLLIGSVIGVMDLTAVAMTSLFVFFSVLEMGYPFPFLIYTVTSVLSLLLLPNKFAAVCYVVFGGLYPVLKNFIERLPSVFAWAAKLLYFNIILSAIIWLSLNILGMAAEDISFTPIIYILGNLTFIMYDIAMTKLISYYLAYLRSRLRIGKYFKK